MRQATLEEILNCVGAVREWHTWHEMIKYGKELYGPTAAFITLEIYNEDDTTTIDDVNVEDCFGNALDLDLTTPWWVKQLSKSKNNKQQAKIITESLYERITALPKYNNMPDHYHVENHPMVPCPVLYID